MSSKWKCLSQEKVLFLSLVPGDTLNILIDRMLIFRRQESPEAFVTLTIVARAITGPANSELKAAYSHFHSVPGVHGSVFGSSQTPETELPSSTRSYYLHGDLCGLCKHLSPCHVMKNFLSLYYTTSNLINYRDGIWVKIR